ncbi:MAG: U32 family peptidase [Clostridiales bacterium]|nr:U32 family peptidase [Clostridiales bacterium]MCF8023111.1 U32 family peptidase [Clostridiales bacterium]
MGRPELLVPAGNWEAFIAAVQNGADAVYIGGRDFSARKSASNFDRQELTRAVEYAHVRGVKVYAAVNTIIADTEMEDAIDFLYFLYNAGVDAVIIQDLGLLKVAGSVIPELELHASTQMTVHNNDGAKLLGKAGIDRIVLARELSLEEIADIKSQSGVEVEVFIHGALCICYSGQCLMSSMIGGRSGNRGRCAQPCRMRYSLEDQSGKVLNDGQKNGEYLLSPKDLNLSENMPRLIEAGIDAFKIEGRLKRAEYVATVTRIYRTIIDRVVDGNFYITGEEKKDLAQIFNRGFTAGYFFGRSGRDMMSSKRPNNRGLLLGRVKCYDKIKSLVEIKLENTLNTGDGLEVWVSRGGRVGIDVHEILINGKKANSAFSGDVIKLHANGDIRCGDRVFKNYDAVLMERAKKTYTSERETKKIPVIITIHAAVGQEMHVSIEDEEGCKGKGATAVRGEQAAKRPLDREFVLKQIDRLGNTPYELKDLYCNIEGEVMFPVREINEARRKAVEDLSLQRSRARGNKSVSTYIYKERLQKTVFNSAKYIGQENTAPLLAVAVSDIGSMRAAVQAGADEVFYGGDGFQKFSKTNIEEAKNYCASRGARLILSTPRILQNINYDDFVLFWKEALSVPVDGVQASNSGIIQLSLYENEIVLYGDFTLNVFNTQSAFFLLEKGLRRITLSPEMTLQQVKNIIQKGRFSAEVMVHGAVPLMVSRYCMLGDLAGGVAKGKSCSMPCKSAGSFLRDRKGIIFPVKMDIFCNMHIFNSRELCMIEHLDSIVNTGASVLRVDARLHDARLTKDIVSIYREGLDRVLNNSYSEKFIRRSVDNLTRYAPEGFTRGHYFRGVD